MGAMAYRDQAGAVESALVEGFTYQTDLESLLVYVRDLVIAMTEWLESESTAGSMH